MLAYAVLDKAIYEFKEKDTSKYKKALMLLRQTGYLLLLAVIPFVAIRTIPLADHDKRLDRVSMYSLFALVTSTIGTGVCYVFYIVYKDD